MQLKNLKVCNKCLECKLVGKTDEEIAKEGLVETEKFMREIGLVMNIRDLGVTEDMIDKWQDDCNRMLRIQSFN